MSKAKPEQQTQTRRASITGRTRGTSGHLTFERLLLWSVGLLLAVRLLIPTEAAVHGESLWIVQIWLVLGLFWTWNCYVSGHFGKRFDWLDAMVWILIAGHVLSALMVIRTSGDKRAALNLLWEWVGLGVSILLVRQLIRTMTARRSLLTGLVSLSVPLAGLGLWQHYVSIPRTAEITDKNLEEYTELSQKMADVSSAVITNSQRRRRLELQTALRGVPLEEPERTLFLKRLQSSTEPFGFFALANTFAGMLVPMLIVATGFVMGLRKRMRIWKIIFISLLILLPIGICLVLTKSRTAWAGLAVGLSCWGMLSLKGGFFFQIKQKLIPGLIIAFSIMSIVAVISFSGGLDREVISEAPKSLKYRLQYWSGSIRVLQDRPILGTGPGNFRQHYLKYKAPEASEEIADPHNLILDVWTSGGVIGVIGLLGICYSGIHNGVKRIPSVHDSSENLDADKTSAPRKQASGIASESPVYGALVIGMASSIPVLLGMNWFFDSFLDLRLVAVLSGWILLMSLFGRRFHTVTLSSACLAGASVSMMVHLLGAGGIEMPAINLTLLLLVTLGKDNLSPEAGKSANGNSDQRVCGPERKTFPVVLLVGACCTLLFGVCMSTSMLPVLNGKSLVRLGDAVWSEDGNPVRAMGLYRDAVKADPFSAEPVERLAELSFQRWLGRPTASEKDFAIVVDFSRMLIDLDPKNSRHYRSLGRKYMKKFERSSNQSDAKTAAGYFLKAVQRYPNHAVLRSETAEALEKSGQVQKARKEAEIALKLDQINRREGHIDKYLSPEIRDKTKDLRERGSD